MKIIFFYTYNKSFLSEYFTELAKLLVQSNHEVYVFSFKSEEQNLKLDGVKFNIVRKPKTQFEKFLKIFHKV